MATYVDLQDGLLHCLPADPRQVAGVVGLHPNAFVRSRGPGRRTNAGEHKRN
jgi:hypothetical protein